MPVMKLYLIFLIIFCTLLSSVHAQSRFAAIDSLVKYRVITAKERPELEKALRKNRGLSDRIEILGELESITLQKTFHINPHKTGLFYSYSAKYPQKRHDSLNIALRLLLEKIKKSGLLTDRVYAYAQKGLDTGRYVAEVQMIGDLAGMSAVLERLAPGKLLPLAESLHKNTIVSDSSFVRLKNDINNGKIESSSQLADYCKLSRVIDLTKYQDDPDIWLEQLHHDIASILPGLYFTNFSYTVIPDTSFSIPGIRYRVSLVCNGQVYKYTSIPINDWRHRQGKISAKDIMTEDFYRIINKVLTDQQSPFRIHSLMFGAGTDTEEHFGHMALIALTAQQAESFITANLFDYLFISMDEYDPALTSGKIDSALIGWQKMGLFAHLPNAEINRGIENAKADGQFMIDALLADFPGVTYRVDLSTMNSQHPYVDLIKSLAKITHGAFTPTGIVQKKIKGGLILKYQYKGKTHSYTFHQTVPWISNGTLTFIKRLSPANNLPGNFYPLRHDDTLIYLTKEQHDYAVKERLLDL